MAAKTQSQKAETDLSYLYGDGSDLKGLSPSDQRNPFLVILQKGSPQVNKKKPEYVEGAEPGDFYNTLTKEVYGPSIKIVVLKRSRDWFIYGPNRGDFVRRVDPYSIAVDKSDFPKILDDDGNEIVEKVSFSVLNADKMQDGPMIFPLKGASLRHAKNFTSDLTTAKTPDGKMAAFFAGVWELTTGYNENSSGDWYTIGVDKTTYNKFIRWIKLEEFTKYVQPARQLVLEQGQNTGNQKMIADNSESTY